MKRKTEKNLTEFLTESNAIEREYSDIAYDDAFNAWKYLIFFDNLTLIRILETHRILMSRLNERIAGRIRKVNVYIGGYIPPKPATLEKRMNTLLKFIPVTGAEIRLWHVMFEQTHPFEDGNGRIGRIVYNFQRVKNNLPIHIIHEKDKHEYYDWFEKI